MAVECIYPPSLSKEQSKFLLSEIKDWSILNGLAVRPPEPFIPKMIDPMGALAVTAPVTLFPSLFPRKCFEEARAIQTAYNELYAAIARDEEWLSEIVEEYAIQSPKKVRPNLSYLSFIFLWTSSGMVGHCLMLVVPLCVAFVRSGALI